MQARCSVLPKPNGLDEVISTSPTMAHLHRKRAFVQIRRFCVSSTTKRTTIPRTSSHFHSLDGFADYDPCHAIRCSVSHRRYASRKATTTKLARRAPLPLVAAVTPTYPTVLQQARANMDKFDNCILLTRVGGFYELYFEHADELGPLLNLKVAKRQTSGGPVSMAGFPFFQLDRYLKMLVQDFNRHVALAEEFPHDAADRVKSGGLLFDRRVARVITPGTLIDESFMDPDANNYVLSVHITNGQETAGTTETSSSVGLAWLDLSTGQFSTQSSSVDLLPALVSRISPREIVLDESLKNSIASQPKLAAVVAEQQLVTYASQTKNVGQFDAVLQDLFASQESTSFSPEEIVASELLLHYVDTRLQGTSIRMQPATRFITEATMVIDRNTMRALEIKTTSKDGLLKGSLLHTIRRTVTRSGARLLDEWLSAPLTSVQRINARLDLVQYMLENTRLEEHIVASLKQSHDSKRVVQKFALGRGDADDLLALASSIQAATRIEHFLQAAKENTSVVQLLARMKLDKLLVLAKDIWAAVDEDAVYQQQRQDLDAAGALAEMAEDVAMQEGTAADTASLIKKSSKRKPTSIREFYGNDNDVWIMKASSSPTLQSLHTSLLAMDIAKNTLTESLQSRLGNTTLSLRWTPGLGHICHVRVKGGEKLDTTELSSVSSSKSTRSFHHPEWTALGKETDQLRIRIRAEEARVFAALREQVIRNLVHLRRTASVLDELDIATSFAVLAREQNLVRPVLTDRTQHRIVAGRHPTVQAGLVAEGRSFISNDCSVGGAEPLWLITGPNMAGKSTFLRQNALITIMAQIGCYVPAQSAEIGIVDQIFSRVGSADNLFRDQSTFMVEMLETATILKHATARSFVIMDEIGRGTTPEDGTAVAFACLHHLHEHNKCRTLFATHFHALTKLSEGMKGVGYYCTDLVEDEDGGFSYVHKLRQGVNRRSHALKVARIAGVPQAAIEAAERVLREHGNLKL